MTKCRYNGKITTYNDISTTYDSKTTAYNDKRTAYNDKSTVYNIINSTYNERSTTSNKKALHIMGTALHIIKQIDKRQSWRSKHVDSLFTLWSNLTWLPVTEVWQYPTSKRRCLRRWVPNVTSRRSMLKFFDHCKQLNPLDQRRMQAQNKYFMVPDRWLNLVSTWFRSHLATRDILRKIFGLAINRVFCLLDKLTIRR